MVVTIEHLNCGGPGAIIDCAPHASFQCYFCKEYTSWYTETKDVSPKELVSLIRAFKYIIKVKLR
jgi:hypothetical protein